MIEKKRCKAASQKPLKSNYFFVLGTLNRHAFILEIMGELFM